MDSSSTTRGLVADLLASLRRQGLSIAVAESLTGGLLALRLTEGAGSGELFKGGLVAYLPEVKRQVLGVPPMPVVSGECAEAMAQGVAALLDARVGLATTGVAGPDTLEGNAVGTVFVGYSIDGRPASRGLDLSHHLSPTAVRHASVDAALETIVRGLRSLASELLGSPSLHT